MSHRVIWLLGIGLCLAWLALAGTLDGWMRSAGVADELRPYAQGLLPASAAFIVTCFAGSYGWLKALLLIFVISVGATLANFIYSALGGPTDFPGMTGVLPHFSIVIVAASAMVAPGVIVGLLARRLILHRRPG